MDFETQNSGRFTLGRQSSRASGGDHQSGSSRLREMKDPYEIESGMRLMYMANEGDIEGIIQELDSGTVDVNFKDIDSRSPLHLAACQGHAHVVQFLLNRGAQVDAKDRWGSTPLADAIYYKNQEVIKLLEKHGAKPPMAPMHVKNAREIPEYEIDPKQLDFSTSIQITKGTYRVASWRGIQVAAKTLGDDVIMHEEKVKAFRDELALLQQIRHPNVVQFLGAVTQSSPMMIVTEYLPKGDFRAFLKRKGALKPLTAVKFALDISRGMNYLHEHKLGIIHRDLEPSNLLRDDTGHLKVGDFDLSKLQKVTRRSKRDKEYNTSEETCWRYTAPEVYKTEEYNTKVDVFSFALIFQEMIEGCPPFASKPDQEVPKVYCANERPPFTAPARYYVYGIKELIEECWNEKPSERPTFRQVINRLEEIEKILERKRFMKSGILQCFGIVPSPRKRRNDLDPSSHTTNSLIR